MTGAGVSGAGPSGAGLRRVAVFGGVGLLATAVHVVTGLTLAGGLGLRPLTANFCAFCAAFAVSYLGHHRLTFRSGAAHLRAAPRFLAVALAGLALNQLIVFAVVDLWGRSCALALALVILTVPALTFALARLWAFR